MPVCGLDATVDEIRDGGEVLLRFDFSGPVLDEALAAAGHVPLPPYIAARREEDAEDRADYQTIYAREPGRGRSADRGSAFHDGAIRAAWRRGA